MLSFPVRHKMKNVALQDLLGTDYGLMSLVVIVGVVVIAAWLFRWVSARMREDEERAKQS